MNKKFYLIYIFILFAQISFGQSIYMPNGGPFTPSGNMRVLIVLAGFENDCDEEDPNYTNHFWPQKITGQETCKTFFNGVDDLFYKDSTQFDPNNQDRSLSNFFYQSSKNSSRPPFKITADIFPERINIKGTSPNNTSVFQAINKKYPDFDWSKYDQRTNNPRFLFDNSKSEPDGIIDYIIVIWRKKGLSGYASTSNYTFKTNAKGYEEKYHVRTHSGFTINAAIWHLPGLKNIFLHELSHSLFNCPHLFSVNGVYGEYFYSSMGYGMMKFGEIFSTPNAWESWLIGWIDLPKQKDIKDASQNGTYVLKDFITTGDAMRVKIPHTNQYLWLENHTGAHVLDSREVYEIDGLGQSIPATNMGLIMYVENIVDSRNSIIYALNKKYSNGIKMLHSNGNYDYQWNSYEKAPEVWDNYITDFIQTAPNPTGAHNDIAFIRGDFGNSNSEGEIAYHDFTNNRCEKCSDCNTCPSARGNEHNEVWKKNGVFVYENLGINMAFGNSGYPQKIGLSHNPVIINNRKYDAQNGFSEPIILHGLSVNVFPKNEDGSIYVEIKLDDVAITENQKLTGNLLLPDKNDKPNSLHIYPGKKLSIEWSGTPDRHNKGEIINNRYEFPDYINPSILTLDSNSHLLVDNKAKLIIKSGSTLYMKKGSVLEVRDKGKLVIEKGAFLAMEEGSEMFLMNNKNLTISTKAIDGTNPLLKIKPNQMYSLEEIKRNFLM